MTLRAAIVNALRRLQAWLQQALPQPSPALRPVPVRIARAAPPTARHHHRIR